MTAPVALVLDDVHVLRNRQCQAALWVLADHVPGGSRMVLAGRSEPPLRVARLRAEGRILEIGAGDLSLTREEASSLLRAAEVRLGGEDMAELYRRTEGWPTGLYLAALYLREGGLLPGAAVTFGGDDRFVTEYMEPEFLARITRDQRAFLTQTAVLERICGPLCEAVLDQPGAGAPDVLALALCERSPMAMGRGDWGLAGDLAGQARIVLRQARMEDGYLTPLVCAVEARAAWHRGDIAAARQLLVSAQRLRSLLTYAVPHLAVQARIELASVHLALGDIPGARTLMREIDELLKRRPGLGTLDDQAQALRARLSADRRPGSPGASSLTAAELRLLPLLVTHLSFPRDRRQPVPVAEHRQIGGGVDLPQARGRLTQPGGGPSPGARAPGGVGVTPEQARASESRR